MTKPNRKTKKPERRKYLPSEDPEIWTSCRIDREVRKELEKHAMGFDTINATLRRLLGLKGDRLVKPEDRGK